MLTLKCFDATESGGGNSRESYGNNRYIYANIRQLERRTFRMTFPLSVR